MVKGSKTYTLTLYWTRKQVGVRERKGANGKQGSQVWATAAGMVHCMTVGIMLGNAVATCAWSVCCEVLHCHACLLCVAVSNLECSFRSLLCGLSKTVALYTAARAQANFLEEKQGNKAELPAFVTRYLLNLNSTLGQDAFRLP